MKDKIWVLNINGKSDFVKCYSIKPELRDIPDNILNKGSVKAELWVMVWDGESYEPVRKIKSENI